jgi:hypothetical protein
MTTNNAASKYYDPEDRNILPIPLSGEFYNLLYDRLHASIENILFSGDNKFTILLVAVDRDKEETIRVKRVKGLDSIYAGCEKQKELLGYYVSKRWGKDPENLDEYNKAWEEIQKERINESKVPIGSTTLQKILSGKYSIEDTLKIGTLKDYFANPAIVDEKAQKLEKIILDGHFNLAEDLYISLPLIGFGEFDGMVHIIFKKAALIEVPGYQEGDENMPYSVIWSLLRAFIVEYDGLFLDWDSVGDNMEKTTSIYDFIYNTVFANETYFNREVGPEYPTILKELKLQRFYKTHAEYFKKRLDMSNEVPGQIYQQYISQSVTAILIDSYAHNVSAHALSTLSWWYFRRARQLGDEEIHWEHLISELENEGSIDPKLLKDFRDAIEEQRNKNNGKGTKSDTILPKDGGVVINYHGSLARELAYLLRFLTEKGAYWSGVTRDANIGGEVLSLYNVLWNDFINNPLYLGTIAKTEDVLKVKIKIVLYDDEPNTPRLAQTVYHEKTFKPENSRVLAWVDLSKARKELTSIDATSPHEETLSPFVYIDNEDFKYMREKLKEVKIFFPGGVVGRHAFYTMIENEIRNVKHYNKEELAKIQEQGLTLSIGVQPWSLKAGGGQELYRVSVWLETPTRLHTGSKHVVISKWEALEGEIFHQNNDTENEKIIKEKSFKGESPRTNTFAPRLGGTQQDKVCAGFLMNGYFSRVQRGDNNKFREKKADSDRDRRYYPWVRPACSAVDEPGVYIHKDYKMSYNTPEGEHEFPSYGYLKKIFYMWRGETLFDASDKKLSGWDTPARFGIVKIEQEDQLLSLRREHGIVRIISEPVQGATEEEKYHYAYKLWLKKLVGGGAFFPLRLMDEGRAVLTLALETTESGLKFYAEQPDEMGSASELDNKFSDFLKTMGKAAAPYLLPLEHTSDVNTSKIRYRSHGIYKTYFNSAAIERSMELFETLATKVCIFDNRIYQRLRMEESSVEQRNLMRDKIKLLIHEERNESLTHQKPAWIAALSDESQNFLKNCHFLVMHLSFIESILKRENPNLSSNDSSNVGLFINEQIVPFIGLRDNFFFVVTTGRGRNEWWTSLDKKENEAYSKFTLFRPIESLLTAIENSIGMEDDIELKYRIAKILFGS